MLAALIKKEIVSTILDLRFIIASLLFLVLISGDVRQPKRLRTKVGELSAGTSDVSTEVW